MDTQSKDNNQEEIIEDIHPDRIQPQTFEDIAQQKNVDRNRVSFSPTIHRGIINGATISGGSSSNYFVKGVDTSDNITEGSTNKFLLSNSVTSDKLYHGLAIYLHQASGTPGAASNYKGYIYFDTTQGAIVTSDGSAWYKLNMTAI